MTFHVGDKVVYPSQGVGTVENITVRILGSAPEKFYLLRFYGNSMTVLVPFSSVAGVGLRKVTKDREIARVLSFLSHGDAPVNPDWKARFKENTGRMQGGDLLNAARVLKSLLRVQLEKPLSFREKRMLDRARYMLISEISTARNAPEIHAVAILHRSLAKAGLTLPPAE